MLITDAEQKALDEIQQHITEEESRLAQLRNGRDNLLRRTKITCRCGAEFAIGDVTYIQTHWYVTPSGCCEGDYWRSGEGQWDCPKCGRNNRLYNKKNIEALQRYFKDTLECYCDQDHSCCSDPRPCNACRKAGRTRDGRARA